MNVETLEAAIADQNRGRWMIPIDPFTMLPCDFRLRIAGPDSDITRTARLEVAERRQRQRFARPTAAEMASEALYLLARIVVDWEGLDHGGEPWPCNQENVEQLLGNVHWLREQVDAFGANRANFRPVVASEPVEASASSGEVG